MQWETVNAIHDLNVVTQTSNLRHGVKVFLTQYLSSNLQVDPKANALKCSEKVDPEPSYSTCLKLAYWPKASLAY